MDSLGMGMAMATERSMRHGVGGETMERTHYEKMPPALTSAKPRRGGRA